MLSALSVGIGNTYAEETEAQLEAALQMAVPATQQDFVQYTAVVVDQETGAPIKGVSVYLSGLAVNGEVYGNEAHFTLPIGSDIQAVASAEGYYTAIGSFYSCASSNIVETLALSRDPNYTETRSETGDMEESSKTPSTYSDMPIRATDPDMTYEPPPSTYTDMPIIATPSDLPQETENPTLMAEQEPENLDSLREQRDRENEEIESLTPPNESGEVSDVPPAWAESNQPYIKGNLRMAEELRLLENATCEQMEIIRETFSIPDQVQICYDADNLADILAVYALMGDMTSNYPYDVSLSTEDEIAALRSIFWDMTSVTGTVQMIGGKRVCVISVNRKSAREMLEEYGLYDQEAVLEGLTGSVARDTVNSLLRNSILSILTDDEFDAIELKLENISGERRAVLLAALSLESKVKYFWGGKSYHVGWDERWGEDRIVTSSGSKQTGTVRPFGLDCSGFVSWAFINAGGDQDIINYIGNGTSMQWYNSKPISMNELQPGDLLFYKPPGGAGTDHVGIYIGDGKVIHCTTNPNGVVVTGLGKFVYARVPYLYGDN